MSEHTERRGMSEPSPITAWTPNQVAMYIGMSYDFVLGEISAGELKASRFGAHWRIHSSEVWRYLAGKGFPVPAWLDGFVRVTGSIYAGPDTTARTDGPNDPSIPAL